MSEMEERLPIEVAKMPTLEEVNKRDILSKQMVCVYLDIPISTLDALLSKDTTFPRKHIGKHVRFLKDAIKEWMRKKDTST